MTLPKPTYETSRIIDKSPIPYGWVIMIVGAIGMVLTSPGQTYGVSIFLEQIIADLEISRSLVSSLYTIGTITGSLALPTVGRLIDKHGSQCMVVIISVLFAIACAYMSVVRNAAMLAFGFVGIRMLGQGSLSMVSRYVVNQWWVRKRGTVLGLSAIFTSILGSGMFPRLINWLIPQFGWRFTYVIMGLLVASIMVPLGWLFFRNKPESYGLLPDDGGPLPGLTLLQPDESKNDKPLEEDWTVSEVVRIPTFWLLLGSTSLVDMLGTGLTFHIVSIFADNGLSADAAANLFLPVAIVSVVMSFASGVLIDIMPAKFLLSLGLIFFTAEMILATRITQPEYQTIFGIVLGLSGGTFNTLRAVIWANYFGRENLGSISGLTTTVGNGASGLGPLWFGVARDLMGSYMPALLVSAILPFILAIAVLFVRKPVRNTT